MKWLNDMTNTARKFLFDLDFSTRSASPGDDIERAHSTAEITSALETRYAEGHKAGLNEANEAAAVMTAKSLKAIYETLESVSKTLDRELARMETDSITMAARLAQLYADALIGRDPLPLFEEAIRKSTAMANNAPVLTVALAPATNELVRQVIEETASNSGFEGRIEICENPDLGPGDIHVTWPNGGILRERARIDMIVKTLMELDSNHPKINSEVNS